MQFLTTIKETVLKYYEFIKEMDEMMISRLRGEDEFDRPKKTEHKRAPRKNHVSVEDLRPQKKSEEAS
ncbi:hypothetical protein [Bdellovibrio sp. KM01]|uniref:hypothetical protein n=1 Tax=Bdellovibrio sp. KM01 TaxID=2748865 RepID=UPI0015E9E6EE|nr:hypothetical protein [Bdellovibrio sp. KM01]QLY26268.1 hypothetical protein HW988_04350 [Bdellovibrio sp. KM01]